MSRVFKRPGDDFWWLDFTLGGRRQRVKTNTKSKRAAEDLLAEKRTDITRVKLGLEVAATSRFGTLAEAWKHWLLNWCPDASKSREEQRFNANVKENWLGAEKLTELSGERLEKWFAQKAKTQAARTVNGHRRIIRCVYNSLIRHRLFRGVNPVKETKPMEEEEFPHQLLTEAEFKLVAPRLPDDWRPLAIIGFTTGLRRGEIYALRKDRNVLDLEKRTLTPRASNGRMKPKGKVVKSIPLFDDALAVLKPAWDAAEYGALLFPSRSGGLRSEYLRAAKILRNAMVRAGLVEGWDHKCRKPDCKGEQLNQRDEQQRLCPVCARIMWAHPKVRQVRFHDLRHSCAVYLLDRGVDMFSVSQMLRHSSIVITQKIYAHRTVETLRSSLDRSNPVALELTLERLAQASPELATELRNIAAKAAQNRHHATNVVPLKPSNRS